MVIREHIEINAPLHVVCGVFSRIGDWENWNTVCQDCCILDGAHMAVDTCFSFTLRPYYLPIKVTPKIIKCEPGRVVVWAGSRMGIHAEHSFLFQEKQTRVKITSVEEFQGFMLWVSRILFIPTKLHRLTKKLLAQIKHQAELCWTAPHSPHQEASSYHLHLTH